MLVTCRGGPGPISLSIAKTKNFDQVRPPQYCWPKWTKFLIGIFSPYLMPLELGACPTCWKFQGGPGPISLRVEKT